MSVVKSKVGERAGILLLIVCILLLPQAAPNQYIVRILNMIGIYMLLGTGVNILTGYTGQLSLGQAAFYGIGAYTTALLNVILGVPFYISFLCSILITGCFGFLLSIPALKVRGSYLALLTIGFGEIVRMVFVNWVSLTRGPSGVTGISAPSLMGYQIGSLKQYYYFILLFVLLGLLYQKILVSSRPGRAFVAIREDERAAELTGINVVRYKITAFVTGAVYSAVAGCLYAHMVRYVSPDSFTSNDSNIILWIIIIGGMGTQLGPVAGAIIMIILPEALRGLGNMRMVVYGMMLLLVIIFTPEGIGSYLARGQKRLKRIFGRQMVKEE